MKRQKETKWRALSNRLDQEMHKFGRRASVWEAYWTRERNRDALLKDFRRAERPFLEEVEEGIRLWCASGLKRWPKLSPAAKAMAAVRLEIVALFVDQFCIGTLGQMNSIIPYPVRTDAQIIRWFLLDWWAEHGRQFACDLWITENWNCEGR
jgi:hypothetical protein